jgi:hypothetical protein
MGKSTGNRYSEEFKKGAVKPVLENKQSFHFKGFSSNMLCFLLFLQSSILCTPTFIIEPKK